MGRTIAVGVAVVATTCVIARLRGAAVPEALPLVCVVALVALVQSSVVLRGGEHFARAMEGTTVSTCRLRILSEPKSTGDAYRCRATLCVPDGHSGDVWLTLPAYEGTGSTISCVGRFRPNAEDEWGTSSRMQGIWGSVVAVRVLESVPRAGPLAWVDGVRRDMLGRIDPASCPERALLAGCLCGSRDGLAVFGLDEEFSRCGLSHLVAVSGGHMAVLASMLCALLVALRLPPVPRGVCAMVLCGTFVLLCGAPASAVRAWAMSCMALAAGWAGRRSHGLSGVCIAGLVMALLDPAACGQLGFVLSVCSVVGLCLFSPYASYAIAVVVSADVPVPRWMPRRLLAMWRRSRPALRDAIAASVVAQLATLPVTVDAFGEVSLVGPVANLLVALPFSAMMTLGFVVLALGALPTLQGLVLTLCDVVAHAILRVVSVLAALPGVAVDLTEVALPATGATIALGIAVLVFWPRVRRTIVLGVAVVGVVAMCAFGAYWRLFAPARICVLDVGQGDAILVQDGRWAILVDAGPDDAVVRALRRNHVTHLDALVITHLHADHYAGMESMVGKVACEQVVVADGVDAAMPREVREDARALTGGDPVEVGYGDALEVGAFALRVVWPTEEVDGSQNAHSLELVATYWDGDRSLAALLTGDAEHEETGAAILAGDVPDVDLLKVGHHGSAVSIDAWEARALDAEVAVASAGKGNSYGHPAPGCVHTLEEAGSLFLCTMDVGDVTVCPGPSGPAVECQKPLPE